MYNKINFTSYFFLCWFTSIWAILSLPVYTIGEFLYKYSRSLVNPSVPVITPKIYYNHVIDQIHKNPNFSYKRYFKIALITGQLNFWCTYMWYITLNLLPISIETAINQDVLFVYFMSIKFLGEKFTKMKTLSVILLTIGLILCGAGNSTIFLLFF